ncbi:hypothetical protein D1007_09506 [Hordeum vulgare]|nr:hypothetical protein D1007_09506 [Hordeum vulgare]
MKRGCEDAVEEPEATIRAGRSAIVVASAVDATESAVVAKNGGVATVVPALAVITRIELLVGEHVQEKVVKDLEQEKEWLKREVHDEIKELFKENRIEELDKDFRKGNEFDEESIDKLSEEDDVEVDYGMDSRHSKSCYTMKHLRAIKIKYHFYGKIGCPFCSKVIVDGFDSLIQHAYGVGDGSARKHQGSILAKDAAFGVLIHPSREEGEEVMHCLHATIALVP